MALRLILFIFIFLPPCQSSDFFANNYSYLLKKNTLIESKENILSRLVDYQSWGRDPIHKKLIDNISSQKLSELSKNEKLAYWINTYNLLTIDLIIKTGETKSIKNQGSLFKNVWKKHKWLINEKPITLHEIEHEILRKFGDSRIHFAINCASLSCPDLHNEPFVAKKIDSQLDDVTYNFLKNNSKGLILKDGEYLFSKVFKWFSNDFGGKKNIRQFIANYVPKVKKSKFSGYIEYNWNLNNIVN